MERGFVILLSWTIPSNQSSTVWTFRRILLSVYILSICSLYYYRFMQHSQCSYLCGCRCAWWSHQLHNLQLRHETDTIFCSDTSLSWCNTYYIIWMKNTLIKQSGVGVTKRASTLVITSCPPTRGRNSVVRNFPQFFYNVYFLFHKDSFLFVSFLIVHLLV